MRFRRDKGIPVPVKGHGGDAGWDLHAPYNFTLLPGETSERIDLGVGFEVPLWFCGFVVERSSQGKKGIHAIGPVVDNGYTGNVHVTLVNNSTVPYKVEEGDRICQMILLRVGLEELEEVDTIEGERGDNGHGSTGT